MYVKDTENPFSSAPVTNAPEIAAKPNKNNKPAPVKETTVVAEDEASQFDFYTILPETESTVTEQEIKNMPAQVKRDSYFLQVGAFQNEADADNMKAKLALQGFEAVIQTATIPEKGVWHRVRVGPLNDLDQINKIRSDLTTNGFNTDLIKVHSETKTN